jgi:hypothetical protein
MTNDTLQIKADEDGWIYLCDLGTGVWKKICDITKKSDLPESVRRKLDFARRTMEALNEQG